MFCSKCGNKIEDGAKFCDNCGNAVAVEQLGTNASVTVSTKKVNKKLPVILGICVVVIILIAISISVLGKKADKVTKIVKAYDDYESKLGNAQNKAVKAKIKVTHKRDK